MNQIRITDVPVRSAGKMKSCGRYYVRTWEGREFFNCKRAAAKRIADHNRELNRELHRLNLVYKMLSQVLQDYIFDLPTLEVNRIADYRRAVDQQFFWLFIHHTESEMARHKLSYLRSVMTKLQEVAGGIQKAKFQPAANTLNFIRESLSIAS